MSWVKSSMRVAACLVLSAALAGCATPMPEMECKRAAHWVGAEAFADDYQRPDYLASLERAFALDAVALPTRGGIVFFRLNYLERLCFQISGRRHYDEPDDPWWAIWR